MKKDKNLPLTETVFYILLALTKPAHGYLIMQKVEELSNGQVKLAAGTLYGAIDNLIKLKFITPVPSDDPRRKVYIISSEGLRVLRLDLERINHMAKTAEAILNN